MELIETLYEGTHEILLAKLLQRLQVWMLDIWMWA